MSDASPQSRKAEPGPRGHGVPIAAASRAGGSPGAVWEDTKVRLLFVLGGGSVTGGT